jgi:hypothetical protein
MSQFRISTRRCATLSHCCVGTPSVSSANVVNVRFDNMAWHGIGFRFEMPKDDGQTQADDHVWSVSKAHSIQLQTPWKEHSPYR